MAESSIRAVRPRGVVLRGQIWPGPGQMSIRSGVIVVDASGHIAALGPAEHVASPPDIPAYGDAQSWIGPGLVDTHVHLMFGSAEEMVRGGVVAVRDLGAPTEQALHVRSSGPGPVIVVAGPILTAPGGYPTTTWGSNGVGVGVATADAAVVVAGLAEAGVDLIKIALEPAAGLPVPSLDVVRAVVDAAHERGLAVTAHALTAATVEVAITAGVDELAHVPTEPLTLGLIERIVAASVTVASTLHPMSAYPESSVRENAAALIAAGVPVVYGSDLGNDGTRSGAEPRELELLAAAGLGPAGALRAATEGAASVAGLNRQRGLGRLVVGEPAALVVLNGDPIENPRIWRQPLVVVVGGHQWVVGERPRGADGTSPANTVTATAGPDDHGAPWQESGPSLGSGMEHRSGPGRARPAWDLRRLLEPFRADLVVALVVFAGCILTGALVGVAWEAIASPARVVIVNGAARFADPEEQSWINADGWFGVLGVIAGVVLGVFSYVRFRARSVALIIGLAVGGIVASYLATWVGRLLGPAPIDPSLADGTIVHGPLAVHAPAVLYAWPITALAIVMTLTAGFDRPPAQSVPAPHW